MKKFLSILLCALCLLGSLVPVSTAALYEPTEEEVGAGSYYLFSSDDGTVISEKNIDEKVAPASITKIVTAILTIENCSDLEQVIAAPSYAIRLLDGTNSSTAGILVDEEMSVRNYLYCLLVYSANDAANVLADFIGGGSIETFVGMMNDFVQKLGCTSTHFVNAHGLDDPDHYTTARDLGTIYSYCIKNSIFCEIAGTNRYEIEATNKYTSTRYLTNTNKMLNSGIADYYCEYVKTGKTGTTDNAGRCVISSASYDGYNYICVMMNAGFYDCDGDNVNENMAFVWSKKMYEWVFENIKLREVVSASEYIGERAVNLSNKYDYVALVPANSVTALVPTGVDSSDVLVEMYPDDGAVNAPVKKGDVLGKAAIKYADNVIAEVDLVAAYDVERSTLKYVVYVIKNIVTSKPFIIVASIVGVCLIILIVILIRAFLNKRRKKGDNIKYFKVGDNHKSKKK